MTKIQQPKVKSRFYAATLLYDQSDELAAVQEDFLRNLLGDVMDDVSHRKSACPDDITLIVQDAITVTNYRGGSAQVFIVQALHPAGETHG